MPDAKQTTHQCDNRIPMTTNYYNAFISIAEDCPASSGENPHRGAPAPTIATLQFDMLVSSPYVFTSDDVLFTVFATRSGVLEDQLQVERDKFFSKGQPCLRSSPLPKRYGWGVHSDDEGRIAIYPVNSAEYEAFTTDPSLRQLKALASKRTRT